MSVFQHLLYDTPQQSPTVDVRTPQQSMADTGRLNYANTLQNQYSNNMGQLNAAYANPNYGIPAGLWASMMSDLANPANGKGPLPTYAQQLDQQQTIMNSALSRASANGAAGSGYANQQMGRGITDYQEGLAKTLADYRLGVLQRMVSAAQVQDQARASYAQAMNYPGGLAAQLYGQSGAQPYHTDTIPQQNALASIFGSSLTQGFGGAAGGWLAKLFGGGGSGGMNVGGNAYPQDFYDTGAQQIVDAASA